MAKYVPKIIQPVLNYVPDRKVEELTAYTTRAIRAKIIADRYVRGFERADRTGGREAYEFETAKPRRRKDGKESRKLVEKSRDGREIENDGYTHEEVRLEPSQTTGDEHSVRIIDIDYQESYDRDSRRFSYITLPFVPGELVYEPNSSFVGIASFGRNNPYYQFTGSEDTLSFTIDWHSARLDRKDVITGCRWVEALTKADGYDGLPHRVELAWGKDGLLFQGITWLVVSAPYRLTQFVRNYREPKTGEIIDVGMLPQQAIQEVTLKRLTDHNLLTSEIMGDLIGRPQRYATK